MRHTHCPVFYLQDEGENPISKMTLAVLEDMGYVVNADKVSACVPRILRYPVAVPLVLVLLACSRARYELRRLQLQASAKAEVLCTLFLSRPSRENKWHLISTRKQS